MITDKENFDKQIEEFKKQAETVKKEIVLPDSGTYISEFAEQVGEELKDKKKIFFRENSDDILEIGDIKDEETNVEYVGFKVVKPKRFITLIEKYVRPMEKKKSRMGDFFIERSINAAIAETVMSSEVFQNKLQKIRRIFTVPIPIIYKGELTFPKAGYDKRFQSWMPSNAPTIDKDMSLDEANEIMFKIYGEFCFQDRQDYIIAVAGLLTPFLRGLFPSFTTRTPVFIYMANRERAGKDYCADITGLVMEGYALQEPPICSGEKGNSNNNEELRKKILSSLIAGRKRLHFANNRGYIDNAVFEGIITSPKFSDRALGRNEMLTFDNEIDFTLSGNVGIGFTADLANRSRIVRLFLDIEDANKREFKNPNLHAWVLENRSKILSALYAFVRKWVEEGMPEGSVPFSSFPEWARICGGVMECCNFESPCSSNEIALGGDAETQDMKILFELGYDKYGEQWITKQDIRHLVINSDEEIFRGLDFNNKSDQTNFGNKIQKFIGRTFSNITLKVKDPKVRAARQQLMFTLSKVERDTTKIFKEKNDQKTIKDFKNDQNVVTLVTNGNLHNPSYVREFSSNRGVETLPKLPGLPKPKTHEFTDEELKQAGLTDEELGKYLEEIKGGEANEEN